MEIEDIIKDICEKEVVHNCYQYKINGVSIYHFIRRDVRKYFINDMGAEFNETQSVGSKIDRIKSILFSFWHILSYRKKTKYLFHTFRLENINGTWLDRFMDPFIDNCVMSGESYVIYETNKGRLFDNRLHKQNIRYDDFLAFLSVICTFFTLYFFKSIKYKRTFDDLFQSIGEFSQITGKRRTLYEKRIIENLFRVRLYEWLLKKINVEVVIAASRSAFVPLMCAAKKTHVKVYELQHGIVYGTTVTYGGFSDNMFIPDKFLAFGNFKCTDNYGIGKNDFVNVGFAFFDYINKTLPTKNNDCKDVLFLSQPDLSDYVIETLIHFAKKHNERGFVLRCHPLEKLNEVQKAKLSKVSNISIQDNKISSIVAINSYKFIVGVLSSVIFEALAYGKIVGVLADGNYSRMINKDDSENLTFIDSLESFDLFLNKKENLNNQSVYSKFDKSLIGKLLR